MTQRSAFVLRIRPGRVDDNEVFGYFEADDIAWAGRYLDAQDVNRRWQDHMAELLEERVPDAGPPSFEEIFRLD